MSNCGRNLGDFFLVCIYLVSGQVVHVSLTKGRNGFLYLQTFYASFHRRINLPAPFLSLKKWQTSAGREKWYYTMYVWVTENLAIEQQLKVETEKMSTRVKTGWRFTVKYFDCMHVYICFARQKFWNQPSAHSCVFISCQQHIWPIQRRLIFPCPIAHTNDGPAAKFELNMTA